MLTITPLIDRLREDLLNGTYAPGQSLIQDDLSQRYGVSRIPIREVLLRLEGEGLVVQEGKRGVIVAQLDSTEAEDLSLMRARLEPLALQLAFPFITKAVLGEAEDFVDAMDRAHDPYEHGKLNWAFHQSLYQPARRPRLLRTLTALHGNADRYMRFQFNVIDNKAQSQQEHRALLAALRDKDLVTSQQLLEQHIMVAGEQLALFLRNHLQKDT